MRRDHISNQNNFEYNFDPVAYFNIMETLDTIYNLEIFDDK